MYYNFKSKFEYNKFFGKIFTLSIILSPFLRQYPSYIPGITLGELFLIISLLLIFPTMNLFLVSRKPVFLIIFWIIGLLTTLLTVLINQTLTFEITTRFIRYSFYIVVILISVKKFNLTFGLKIYRKICILVSVYLLLQIIVYNFNGYILPINILPIRFIRNISMERMYYIARKYYFRPHSVFTEPGYAVHFLLPGLIFSLFGWFEKSKIDFITSTVIFISLILSTSVQGIILGLFIIGLFLLTKINNISSYFYVIRNTLIIFIVIIMLLILYNVSAIQIAINKVNNITRSVGLRLFRGFLIFNDLPLLTKIIGVGHGNVGKYVIENEIHTKYDPEVLTPNFASYVNGISRIMLYYGFIGFSVFLIFYFDILKKTEVPFKILSLTYLVLLMGAGGFFSIELIFYFSFIYSGYEW